MRYALTALLLGLVVWKVNVARVAAALTSVHLTYLLVALALTIPFLYFKALRWYVLLRSANIDTSFGEASISLVGGMGLALLTPARLGELVRAAYLRDPRKLRIGGLVLIDKGFDVLVLAGLSIAGGWILLGWWAGALLALITFAGLIAVYRPASTLTGLGALSTHLPLRSRLEQVWGSIEALSAPATTLYLALTLAAFAIVLVQFGIVLLNWHSWSPEIVLLTFPLVILTNVLPITIGGLGVREGAAALLLPHYGVSPAHAALAAFLMFFINTALPGLIGAVLLPAMRWKKSPPVQPAGTP